MKRDTPKSKVAQSISSLSVARIETSTRGITLLQDSTSGLLVAKNVAQLFERNLAGFVQVEEIEDLTGDRF